VSDVHIPPTSIPIKPTNAHPPTAATSSGFKASREDLHEAVVSALDDLRNGLDALDAVMDWICLAKEIAEGLNGSEPPDELDAIVRAIDDAKGSLEYAESDLDTVLERTRESESDKSENDESDASDNAAADPATADDAND
jgi:hypothetical protein